MTGTPLSCFVFVLLVAAVSGVSTRVSGVHVRAAPFLSLRAVLGPAKSPAIVQRYLLRRNGRNSIQGAIFLPGKATYIDLATQTPIGDTLDALYVPGGGSKDVTETAFLTVALSKSAQVFLLMRASGLGVSALDVGNAQVDGLNSDMWKGLRALRSKSGRKDYHSGHTAQVSPNILPERRYRRRSRRDCGKACLAASTLDFG